MVTDDLQHGEVNERFMVPAWGRGDAGRLPGGDSAPADQKTLESREPESGNIPIKEKWRINSSGSNFLFKTFLSHWREEPQGSHVPAPLVYTCLYLH